MSQHHLASSYSGTPINIVIGWDRPLGYFFMTIEWAGAPPASMPEEQGEYLYSNLGDPESIGAPLDYYRTVLERLGLIVPESMFTEADNDRRNNVGNRVVVHEADGSFH